MADSDAYGEPIDPRLGIGGNHPPDAMSEIALMLSPAVIRDQLELDYAHLITRRDELLDGLERFFKAVPTIETVEQMARAADFKRQFDLHWTETEGCRKAEVKPLDDAKATHQKFFKAETLDPLDRGRKDILAKMTVFQRKEDKRIQEEQAAEKKRLQDEADKLAAAALQTQRPSLFEEAARAQAVADAGPRKVTSTVRGTASTASLRTRYTYEEVDLALVPREWLCLDAARAQAAINAGLRDAEDGTPAIPGLRIVDASSTVVRR